MAAQNRSTSIPEAFFHRLRVHMKKNRKAEKLPKEGTFFSTEDGLFMQLDGEKQLICSPISICGKAANSDGSSPAYVLRLKTIVGTIRRLQIPVSLIPQASRFEELLINAGVIIEPAARKHVLNYIRGKCPATFFLRVQSEGWVGLSDGRLAYILGKEVFGEEGNTIELLLEGDVESRFSSAGEIGDWLKITKLCVGNPLVVFAMCAAFSSALLRPLGFDSGFVTLVGPSSTGKSTLLRLINSLFSDPDTLYTWEGTDNGIEALVMLHKDVPMSLDEITEENVGLVGDAVYRLTNSSGKSRATSSGDLAESRRTRTVVFSSGENSAVNLLRGAGKAVKLGQLARFTNIPVREPYGIFTDIHDEENSAAFIRNLDIGIRKTYGVAWPQYVKYLAESQFEVKPEFEKVRDKLRGKIAGGAEFPIEDGVVSRVLDRFAISAFAGFAAVDSEVVVWKKSDVVSAARHCFGLWIEEYCKQRTRPHDDFINALRYILQSHRLPELYEFEFSNNSNAIGFIYKRRRVPESVFLIFPEFMNRRFGKMMSNTEMNNALRQSGYLHPGTHSPTAQVRVPGTDLRPSFYVISQSILNG
jgi:putative DNA primase/helicase